MRVHEDAEEEVEAVNEGLCADERLPEIERAAHFAEEFDEDDGAAEAVDGGHDGGDGDGEGDVGEDACGGGDGGVGEDAEGGVGSLSCGAEDPGVGDYPHYGEDAEGVEPDGEVGEPSQASEGADLAEYHACVNISLLQCWMVTPLLSLAFMGMWLGRRSRNAWRISYQQEPTPGKARWSKSHRGQSR